MLECVLVVGYIVVVVVGVGKEGITIRKYISCAQIRSGQLCFMWLLDREHFLGIVGKILAQLIAQVGVGITVTYYLDWF